MNRTKEAINKAVELRRNIVSSGFGQGCDFIACQALGADIDLSMALRLLEFSQPWGIVGELERQGHRVIAGVDVCGKVPASWWREMIGRPKTVLREMGNNSIGDVAVTGFLLLRSLGGFPARFEDRERNHALAIIPRTNLPRDWRRKFHQQDANLLVDPNHPGLTLRYSCQELADYVDEYQEMGFAFRFYVVG